MKTKQELQKHLDWINNNLEPLQEKKKALENAIKAIDGPEFDFEKLMPVGSVWLGTKHLKVIWIGNFCQYPIFETEIAAEGAHKEIYYAHQIVKAAQLWFKDNDLGIYEPCLIPLDHWIKEAKKAGVLQNMD